MENKTNEQNQLLQKILFQKYRIIKLLSNDSNNLVYQGINIIDKSKVAIKLENKVAGKDNLTNESYILLNLKGQGIPEIISFGHSGKYNVLIEELLGKSLQELYEQNDNEIPLKDICMIAIQILERLQYIHSKYIIHRNINPSNFLIGTKNPSLIYMIDFAYAKKYRSSRTGNHIKFRLNQKINGQISYISANAMRGGEQSRKDDLESFGYMIIYLLKGFLPWKEFENNKNKFIKIYELKNKISSARLCRYLPDEIKILFEYTKKLSFEQEPNYEYLRGLFKDILIKMEKINDNIFFWNKIKNKIKNKSKNRNKNEELEKNKGNKSTKILLFKKKESSYKGIFRKFHKSISNENNKIYEKLSERTNNKSSSKDRQNYFELLPLDETYQNHNQSGTYNSNFLNNSINNPIKQSKSIIDLKSFVYKKKNNIRSLCCSCKTLENKEKDKVSCSKDISSVIDKYYKNKMKTKNNKSDGNLRLLTISDNPNASNLKQTKKKNMNFVGQIYDTINNSFNKQYNFFGNNLNILNKNEKNYLYIKLKEKNKDNKINKIYLTNENSGIFPKCTIYRGKANSNFKNNISYNNPNFIDKLNIIGYLKNANCNQMSNHLCNSANKNKKSFNKIIKANINKNVDINIKQNLKLNSPIIDVNKKKINNDFNAKEASYIFQKNDNNNHLIFPNYIYNINQIQYSPRSNIKKTKKDLKYKIIKNGPNSERKHNINTPIVNSDIDKISNKSKIIEFEIDFSKSKSNLTVSNNTNNEKPIMAKSALPNKINSKDLNKKNNEDFGNINQRSALNFDII